MADSAAFSVAADRVCTEVFVFDAGDLLGRLEALPDDGSAGDYGDVLIPDLVADGRAFEHRMHGYWRDIGTIGAYHRAHMELVADEPPLRLDDPAWPLLTGSITGGPAHVMSVPRSTARCSGRVRWSPAPCTTAWSDAEPLWRPERSCVRA